MATSPAIPYIRETTGMRRRDLRAAGPAVRHTRRELPPRSRAQRGRHGARLRRPRPNARDIVVKALPAELSAVVNRERFRREIQIAGRLHHQRIVPVLAAGESGSLLYYTMPYIEGDTLRAFLSARGPLSWQLAVRLAADIADALAYAHEHNVIHRDIKPDNVLIDDERAMVTDFGIARAIERSSAVESVTSTGFTLLLSIALASR